MIGYLILLAVLWAVLSIAGFVLRGMVPTTEVFSNADLRKMLFWTAVAAAILTALVWVVRLA